MKRIMKCSYCGKDLTHHETYLVMGDKTFCSELCWRNFDRDDDDLLRWENESF